MPQPRVLILGAGPAGLGAAWRLRVEQKADAIVLEQRDDVGGNAGGFELEGLPVDYGSHRLHPACHPRILNDLRNLLGGDLLDRPRHGRIRLRGRWLHFPLKPLDLALHCPKSFVAGVALDTVRKRFSVTPANGDSFASVLERGLGRTICRDFYFPYAVKIWGRPPETLSATQARRRVAAGSLGKIFRKIMGIVPGLKAPGAGRFYYPRGGYGQICRAIRDAAEREGADVRLNTTVRRLTLGSPHRVEIVREGRVETLEGDHVWSTVPITVLARLADPPAPPDVIEAARRTEYRAMVLIYLVLDQPQFSEYDAHYFPETHIPLTRLSEPKNYAARSDPPGKTILCGELPCQVDDDIWRADDEQLGRLVRDALAACDLPVRARVLRTVTRRLPYAYPIYPTGYECCFDRLDEWAGSLPNVLSYGRQGLFAHDNTHHALAMAYGAVDCLSADGRFDAAKWSEYRDEFRTHVVED